MSLRAVVVDNEQDFDERNKTNSNPIRRRGREMKLQTRMHIYNIANFIKQLNSFSTAVVTKCKCVSLIIPFFS